MGGCSERTKPIWVNSEWERGSDKSCWLPTEGNKKLAYTTVSGREEVIEVAGCIQHR